MNYIKTSLYDEHNKLGAKIIPFAGYLMPVNYKEGLTLTFTWRGKGYFCLFLLDHTLFTGIEEESYYLFSGLLILNQLTQGLLRYTLF